MMMMMMYVQRFEVQPRIKPGNDETSITTQNNENPEQNSLQQINKSQLPRVPFAVLNIKENN